MAGGDSSSEDDGEDSDFRQLSIIKPPIQKTKNIKHRRSKRKNTRQGGAEKKIKTNDIIHTHTGTSNDESDTDNEPWPRQSHQRSAIGLRPKKKITKPGSNNNNNNSSSSSSSTTTIATKNNNNNNGDDDDDDDDDDSDVTSVNCSDIDMQEDACSNSSITRVLRRGITDMIVDTDSSMSEFENEDNRLENTKDQNTHRCFKQFATQSDGSDFRIPKVPTSRKPQSQCRDCKQYGHVTKRNKKCMLNETNMNKSS